MDTQTETGENASVYFTGLLAHRFENVIQDSILFDLEEITLDGFFQRYKGLLDQTPLFGFPACCSPPSAAVELQGQTALVFGHRP